VLMIGSSDQTGQTSLTCLGGLGCLTGLWWFEWFTKFGWFCPKSILLIHLGTHPLTMPLVKKGPLKGGCRQVGSSHLNAALST